MNDKMRRFVTGLLIGMVSEGGMPETEKTLVGYSYNGVVLPELPVVEGYDYAVIGHTDTYAFMFICTAPMGCRYYESHTSPYALYMPNGGSYRRYSVRRSTGEVVAITSGDVSGTNSFIKMTNEPLWSNQDIYYLDDNLELTADLCIAASDPVPVYE